MISVYLLLEALVWLFLKYNQTAGPISSRK